MSLGLRRGSAWLSFTCCSEMGIRVTRPFGRFDHVILRIGYCLIHDPSGHRVAIFILFRGVHTVRLQIHGKAVYCMLYFEILKLAIVVGIVLMKHGNGSAIAGSIN